MDVLLESSCVGQTVDDICKSRFASEYYRRALATLELLMVKHGVLDVTSAVPTSMTCLILSVSVKTVSAARQNCSTCGRTCASYTGICSH